MGDANRLKTVLIEKCASKEIDDTYFKQVLKDNIEACMANGYKNKQMILEFALKVVVKEVDERRRRRSQKDDEMMMMMQMKTSIPSYDDDDKMGSMMMTTTTTSNTTTTHAPQFVDDSQKGQQQQQYVLNSDHIEVTLLPDIEGDFINAMDYTSSSSSSSSSNNNKKKIINNKKKSLKSDLKKGRSRLAMHASKAVLHCIMMIEMMMTVMVMVMIVMMMMVVVFVAILMMVHYTEIILMFYVFNAENIDVILVYALPHCFLLIRCGN